MRNNFKKKGVFYQINYRLKNDIPSSYSQKSWRDSFFFFLFSLFFVASTITLHLLV